jgi:hypothetical protein
MEAAAEAQHVDGGGDVGAGKEGGDVGAGKDGGGGRKRNG